MVGRSWYGYIDGYRWTKAVCELIIKFCDGSMAVYYTLLNAF